MNKDDLYYNYTCKHWNTYKNACNRVYLHKECILFEDEDYNLNEIIQDTNCYKGLFKVNWTKNIMYSHIVSKYCIPNKEDKQ